MPAAPPATQQFHRNLEKTVTSLISLHVVYIFCSYIEVYKKQKLLLCKTTLLHGPLPFQLKIDITFWLKG